MLFIALDGESNKSNVLGSINKDAGDKSNLSKLSNIVYLSRSGFFSIGV